MFIPENHRRLKDTRDYFLSLLDTIKVPYIKPRSGFFVLVDFSQYLDEPTFEAEKRLNDKFLKNKVMLTAGDTMYCSKAGWFRIVFTSVERSTLTEGNDR